MTRSSVLWIDGKSGLFLEPLQTRHPLSRSRSVRCAHAQEHSDEHCDVNSGNNYRNWDSLLKLGHSSTESDLLTHAHDQLRRHGSISSRSTFCSSYLRQVSPIWRTRGLLGSWVGALCLFGSIESFFVRVKVRLQYRPALFCDLHGHSAHCPLCRRKACAVSLES